MSSIGIGSAQSAPHHFYAVDQSANNILEQQLVCHSFSRLLHSCHTLSRWPWSAPLHRNNTSLDCPVSATSSIPDKSHSMSRWPWSSPLHLNRFESSRLHDLNHLTLRFSSLRGCARFTVRIRRRRVCLNWLLHKTLHASNQIHSHQVHQFPYPVARQPPSFRCQQRLTQSKRVSLPASSRPWLVVTTAISLRCDDIFQHPAVVPCHGSQQSHSGGRVFSLSLQLRDRCVSSTSL